MSTEQQNTREAAIEQAKMKYLEERTRHGVPANFSSGEMRALMFGFDAGIKWFTDGADFKEAQSMLRGAIEEMQKPAASVSRREVVRAEEMMAMEQRYNSRGRKLNTNPLRKIVEIVFEPMKDIHGEPLIIYGDEIQRRLELLECGHKVRVKQDIYGETNATRRRCHKCGRCDDR